MALNFQSTDCLQIFFPTFLKMRKFVKLREEAQVAQIQQMIKATKEDYSSVGSSILQDSIDAVFDLLKELEYGFTPPTKH